MVQLKWRTYGLIFFLLHGMLAGSFVSLGKSAEPDWQTVGVQDKLPIFYQQIQQRLIFPLAWNPKSNDDYKTWQSNARHEVLRCWQAPPPAATYEMKIVASKPCDGYTSHKIAFNLTADSRVLAYLLVPDGAGPFPAVLLLHDHGGEFRIGKEKVVEPWDYDPEKTALAKSWVKEVYGGRFLGDELAKRGYVCLATDALNWSDRGGGGYELQQAISSNLLLMGSSFAGLIAHEDVRAAEFLAQRPEVDAKRVAAMGMSMGSFRTWQVSAMSDHIAAGVAVCSIGTINQLLIPSSNVSRGQSAYTMLHPGLANLLDNPDVASLACPKPMLFYNGRQDSLFPMSAVEPAYKKMRTVWESQNAGDRLVTKHWDTGHVFNRAMQDEAFPWLDAQLNHQP